MKTWKEFKEGKWQYYGTNPNDEAGQWLAQQGVDPKNPSDVESETRKQSWYYR